MRLEVQSGSVGMDAHAERTLAIAGGVRRAADTGEALAVLERIPLEFEAAPDPADASTLVVRAPAQPADLPLGVFALELGIRVPADLPVEVVVAGSGDLTFANRAASTQAGTGRGDLIFKSCAGGVSARTGRGNVIAYEHRGDLDVQTRVGDMQAFVREPGANLRLVTGQGTVQCHVPESIEFDVDARAETGRIGNGFGLTAERVREYGAALTGRRGRATTKLVLRTGSGYLSLSPHPFD